MATQAYRTWNAAGRPYRVADPIVDLVVYARGMGIRVLGVIGNQAHLEADPPEDHTPYPENPWPGKLPDYVVTACDLADGAHADVLLDHARQGRAPWVKYLNFRGHHYDVRNGWKPTPSGDEHLHASIRSDCTYQQLTFNPLKGGTMAQTNYERKADAAYNLFPVTKLDTGGGKLEDFATPVTGAIKEVEGRLNALEVGTGASDERLDAAVRRVLSEMTFRLVIE